jgi:hypothetical protein
MPKFSPRQILKELQAAAQHTQQPWAQFWASDVPQGVILSLILRVAPGVALSALGHVQIALDVMWPLVGELRHILQRASGGAGLAGVVTGGWGVPGGDSQQQQRGAQQALGRTALGVGAPVRGQEGLAGGLQGANAAGLCCKETTGESHNSRPGPVRVGTKGTGFAADA